MVVFCRRKSCESKLFISTAFFHRVRFMGCATGSTISWDKQLATLVWRNAATTGLVAEKSSSYSSDFDDLWQRFSKNQRKRSLIGDNRFNHTWLISYWRRYYWPTCWCAVGLMDVHGFTSPKCQSASIILRSVWQTDQITVSRKPETAWTHYDKQILINSSIRKFVSLYTRRNRYIRLNSLNWCEWKRDQCDWWFLYTSAVSSCKRELLLCKFLMSFVDIILITVFMIQADSVAFMYSDYKSMRTI